MSHRFAILRKPIGDIRAGLGQLQALPLYGYRLQTFVDGKDPTIR